MKIEAPSSQMCGLPKVGSHDQSVTRGTLGLGGPMTFPTHPLCPAPVYESGSSTMAGILSSCSQRASGDSDMQQGLGTMLKGCGRGPRHRYLERLGPFSPGSLLEDEAGGNTFESLAEFGVGVGQSGHLPTIERMPVASFSSSEVAFSGGALCFFKIKSPSFAAFRPVLLKL